MKSFRRSKLSIRTCFGMNYRELSSFCLDKLMAYSFWSSFLYRPCLLIDQGRVAVKDKSPSNDPLDISVCPCLCHKNLVDLFLQ